MAANKTKPFLREPQKASQLSGEPNVGESGAGWQKSPADFCWTKYKPVQEPSADTFPKKGRWQWLNSVISSTWEDFKEIIAKHVKEVFQKCVRKEIFSRNEEIEIDNYVSTSYYMLN